MKKNKKLNNKGFSLVELIIVIAIMAVLVGVLAPQFTKYIEQARRGKDCQAAANLQTAYLADIASNMLTGSGTFQILDTTATTTYSGADAKINKPSTVNETLAVSGKLSGCTNFVVTYDATAGTCSVGVGSGNTMTHTLTTEAGATAYKNAN